MPDTSAAGAGQERSGGDGSGEDRPGADPGGHVELVDRSGKRRQPVEALDAAELRAQASDQLLNLPNVLTAIRIALVPFILVLVLIDTREARWWAFGLFTVAAISDQVDGWVARRWHGVTRWGQIADPIADKLLVIGTLSALAVMQALPWWVVIVIVAREVGVTLLRVLLVSGYDLVMPASRWGKAKTLTQAWAIGIFLVPGISQWIRNGLLYIAVGLTVVSGIEYAFRAGRLVREEAS